MYTVVGWFSYIDKKTNSKKYGVHLIREMKPSSNCDGNETKIIFTDEFVPAVGQTVDVRFNDRGYVDSVSLV